MREKILRVIGIIIGIALIPVLIGWGINNSEQYARDYPWKASIFLTANKNNIIDSKDVKSLDECRAWVNERTKNFAYKEGEWDYSCGKNCKFSDDTISGGKRVNKYVCTEITK